MHLSECARYIIIVEDTLRVYRLGCQKVLVGDCEGMLYKIISSFVPSYGYKFF